jgi:hypothetical protein
VRKKERTEKHKNQQDKAWTGKDYRGIFRTRNLREYKSQVKGEIHINVGYNETDGWKNG